MTHRRADSDLVSLALLAVLGAAPACQGYDEEGAATDDQAAATATSAQALSATVTVALGGPDTFPVRLTISGITPDQKTIIGGFKTMSGMDSETEVIEMDAGEVSDVDSLRSWARAGGDAAAARRNASIIVYDWSGKNVMAEYRLTGTSLTSFSVKATAEGWVGAGASSAMAIEKIEIANEKVERVLR
jgi:hypothetical protein